LRLTACFWFGGAHPYHHRGVHTFTKNKNG